MLLSLVDHSVKTHSKSADIYNIPVDGLHPFVSLTSIVGLAVKVPRARNCELRQKQNQLLTDLKVMAAPNQLLDVMICPSFVDSVYTGGKIVKAYITPWFENGNVLTYVQRNRSANKLQLVQDLAIGLEYVHSQGDVVGNVHPGNVMVTHHERALLADVGLSALTGQLIFETEGRFRIPEAWPYKPAEEFFPLYGSTAGGMIQRTMAMDVYSFSTTAYAIFEEASPFHGGPFTVEQGVMKIYRNGHRHLVKPTEMSQALWILLQRCLEHDPSRRPSMTEVVTSLKAMLT